MLLKLGDRGPEVQTWQSFLQGHYFLHDTADGMFGPKTEMATRAFQAAFNLREDGMVGDLTVAEARKHGFAGFPVVIPPPFEEAAADDSGVADKNDKMLSHLHPTLKARVKTLIDLAKQEGHILQIVQGLRTFEEQDALFNQAHDGRDNDGDGKVDEPDEHVTNARGGQSWHNFGLAADLAFVVNGKIDWTESLYDNIGEWAKTCNLEWGGTWKKIHDRPHVQLPGLTDKPSLSVIAVFRHSGLQAVWQMF